MLEVELIEERNPANPDSQVAEATLHLKGVTLRATERLARHQARDQPGRRGARPPGQAPPRQAPQAPRAARRRAGAAAAPPSPAGRAGHAPGRLRAPGTPVAASTLTACRSSTAPCASARPSSSSSTRSASSAINALRARARAARRRGAARAADALRERARDGESLDDLLPETFARRARGRAAHDGHAPLRRAADRRHGPARRRDRRDAHRRGQDAHRHARRRPQRARRQGRARRHGQRLPRPPRRRVDEPDLRRPRPDRRACCRTCSPTRTSAPPTPPTSRTARTPSSASTTCATTWPRRWRRRSSTAAASARTASRSASHHFAIVDEVDNILIDEARTPLIISGAPEQAADLYEQFAKLAPQLRPGKKPEGMDPRTKKEFVADFDYEFDEKHKTVSVTEQGVAKAEKLPRHRPPLPRRERPARQPPQPGAEGRVALQARRRLRGGRRRGEDHRRVHRPHPRRPALVGGPAPGRRGEGGRARPGGEPDARDDHAAELLPHVRQARGHDRHGPHRGDRVHEDLQAAGRRRSRPTGRWSARTRTTRSTRPRTASGRAVAREIAERHEEGQPVLVGTISVEVSELLVARS